MIWSAYPVFFESDRSAWRPLKICEVNFKRFSYSEAYKVLIAVQLFVWCQSWQHFLRIILIYNALHILKRERRTLSFLLATFCYKQQNNKPLKNADLSVIEKKSLHHNVMRPDAAPPSHAAQTIDRIKGHPPTLARSCSPEKIRLKDEKIWLKKRFFIFHDMLPIICSLTRDVDTFFILCGMLPGKLWL